MLIRNFTSFPVLTTERLSLRQLSIDDEQEIFALRSDDEINKYIDRQPSKTIEDARNFINQITDSIKNNESIYWGITLKGSNKLAGTILLFHFSDESNKCEIGYELLTRHQGQGIMKEAMKRVIDYAFREIKFQTIEAFVHKDNRNSTKLLEKFSFKKSKEPEKANPNYFVFTLESNP